jgi:hypothetical protein
VQRRRLTENDVASHRVPRQPPRKRIRYRSTIG